MFRAIGTLIVIYGIVHIFGTAAESFEVAIVSVFEMISISAQSASEQMTRISP
jgi:hypothetical protein